VAIQGTARPTHYYVILDEMRVKVDDFQKMIYEHCYQYMRSTTPVSLYPAIYYAHLASNRARAHENISAASGPQSGQKFIEAMQARNLQAAQAATRGVAPSVTSYTSIESTEAAPLLAMGQQASDTERASIHTSMWYI
jgi:eukaryotic translation initiation factor 2C